MIGGVQKKMLLTINNGKFELDELFKELVGPNENTQWKLVRERDNLTKYSDGIIWMEWNEDRTFKAKHEHIGVGYSLLMSPFNDALSWQTTEIVDFHVREEGVCLLATSMVIGETFYYQIPLGCALIMIGVGLESFRN